MKDHCSRLGPFYTCDEPFLFSICWRSQTAPRFFLLMQRTRRRRRTAANVAQSTSSIYSGFDVPPEELPKTYVCTCCEMHPCDRTRGGALVSLCTVASPWQNLMPRISTKQSEFWTSIILQRQFQRGRSGGTQNVMRAMKQLKASASTYALKTRHASLLGSCPLVSQANLRPFNTATPATDVLHGRAASPRACGLSKRPATPAQSPGWG